MELIAPEGTQVARSGIADAGVATSDWPTAKFRVRTGSATSSKCCGPSAGIDASRAHQEIGNITRQEGAGRQVVADVGVGSSTTVGLPARRSVCGEARDGPEGQNAAHGSIAHIMSKNPQGCAPSPILIAHCVFPRAKLHRPRYLRLIY